MTHNDDTLEEILNISSMILDKIIGDPIMKALPPFETIAAMMLLSVRMGLTSGMSSDDLESLFSASVITSDISIDQISCCPISSSH
jgi:hypothetical protein